MRSEEIFICPLEDVEILTELAKDAEKDGRRMVSRLMEDWGGGSNRFDKKGEKIYCAIVDGHVRGVCGLNCDPYTEDVSVGRIRRLYVAVEFRRRGIASAIVRRLIKEGREHFKVLHLRTDDSDAAVFYEAIGFTRVEGNEHCTHRRQVST